MLIRGSVAVLLCLTAMVGPAEAIDGGPAPKDPPGAVANTKFEAASEVVVPGTAETDDSAVRTGKNVFCRKVTTRATAKSVAATVFWLQQRVTWCYNGTRVIFRYRYPTQTYANGYLFWSDDDPASITSTSGTPWRLSLVQRFQQCPPLPWDVACVRKYADLDLVLKPNGLYTVDQDIR